MLELRAINKSYHAQCILQIASLQLEKGIYWIKGANGSGKTTFLKMIAGLLPFEGDILYNTISQKKQPIAYRQKLGWAEAEPLYPSFITGMDLVHFYQDVRKVPQQEIDKLLVLFNMQDYVEDKIGTYSAGMTKKLSIVLAFMGSPPLCILDEPLITLDTNAFAAITTLILESNKQKGTSFLMSSHQELDSQLTHWGKELTISNKSISYTS